MRRIILLLLVFVLFLQSASAVEDFSIFGDTSVVVQQCLTTQKNITITNTAEFQNSYSLSVDGQGSEFVKFSKLSFTLNPGQSETITAFYTIPCDEKEASYSFDIYFTTLTSEDKLSQEITITALDNIDVTVAPSSVIINPCDTATYQITLKNSADFEEVYTISAEGFPVRLTQTRVILTPGSEADITLTAAPADCAQYGEFPITITINAIRSEFKEEFLLDFIITPTDIPDLAPGITTIRTGYDASEADLTIQNIGDRITTYSLELEGPGWASINPKQLTLAPEETGTVALYLNPSNETAEDVYEAALIATVEATGVVYSKAINIKLKTPNVFERNPWLIIGIAIAIVIVIILVILLVLYLRSPKYKEKRRKKREELKKKRAEKQAKIKAEREQMKQKALSELKKQYKLVAREEIVKGKKKPVLGKIIWVITSVILIIVLACLIIRFWSIVAPNWQYILLGIVILVLIAIFNAIAKCKCVIGKWKTLLAGQKAQVFTGWAKGLGKVLFKADKPVARLVMAVLKEKPQLKPGEHVVQSFSIKTNAPEAVSGCTCVFKVKKKWLARRELNKENVRLVRFTGDKRQTVPSRPTHEDKKYVYYTAECKLGTYAIIGKQLKKKKEAKSKALVWGIIAIIIIAVLAFTLTPKSSSEGIPTQTWWQDTTHTLKLSNYFKDPDGDKLTYYVNDIEHITIDIIDDTAYFTPKPGWTGIEQVRFMADDGKGGTITSNTANLIVKESMLSPAARTIFNTIIILLLVLIVIAVFLSFKRELKQTKSED